MKVLTGGSAKKRPRVVLYGPPGVGKTTFGAAAEKPLVLPSELGCDNIPGLSYYPLITKWEAATDAAAEVAREQHDYQTIVIDTLNGLADLAARFVCTRDYGGQWEAAKGREGFMSWARGWKATVEEFRPLLASLDACRERGMTVILLAHQGVQTVRTPLSAAEFTKYQPNIHKDIWGLVCAWADVVIRADYEYAVTVAKGRGLATTGSKRIAYGVGSAAEDVKARVGYELSAKFDLDYQTFVSLCGRTDGLVREELLALWPSLDPEKQAKTLAWAGCAKPEDMAADKARIIVNRLKQVASESEGEKQNG